MAIKRMRVNDDGEFEERQLEKSELPPPPPPKPQRAIRAARVSSAATSKTGKNPKTSGAGVSRVEVTKHATKAYASGKTALDHDVIRFECPKCGASRVGKDGDTKLQCSLCDVLMRRLR